MRQILTFSLLFSTLRMATPLVLAALGGLYSERAGVINIALEGLLLRRCVYGCIRDLLCAQSVGRTGAAIIAGAAVAAILALACIKFKADQVVTGTGINILFIGLPAVLSGALFLSSGSTPQIPKENLLPELSHFVPGFMAQWRIFSDVSVISLIALVVVLVTAYILYRTAVRIAPACGRREP
jgi:simple sugar transport system permease protein